MKNVLIVGYPKSGTTWTTLLVAEILHAPVLGYWRSEHQELAINNTARDSEYACFKSHAEFNILEQDQDVNQIIYVVRDPRSIVDSIKHYFYHAPLKSRNIIARIVNKIHWIFYGRNEMEKEAQQAVLFGNEALNINLKQSWTNHYKAFKAQDDVFILRYEDLLNKPMESMQKVCDLFDKTIEVEKLETIYSEFTFKNMKQGFKLKKNREGQYLMRSGKIDSWKSNLRPTTIAHLEKSLEDDLKVFNYPNFGE